jgi:iron complex outermembrane receptor protein
LEDLERLEIVRGPGSALYGANAFSGVMNLTTPAPKEVRGTKIALSAGELDTRRAHVRYAEVKGAWSYKLNLGYVRSGT